MFDFVRLGTVLARATLGAKVSLLDEVRTSFLVTPWDSDVNRHLNNGRYLQVMDVGRFDLVARSGLGPELARRRWVPVVGGVHMEFLRELPLFARFTVATRIVGWDHRWFYVEQRFLVGGRLAAIGRVQAQFRGPKGRVAPVEVLAELGPVPATPALPEAFTQAFATRTRRERAFVLDSDDLPGLGSFAA